MSHFAVGSSLNWDIGPPMGRNFLQLLLPNKLYLDTRFPGGSVKSCVFNPRTAIVAAVPDNRVIQLSRNFDYFLSSIVLPVRRVGRLMRTQASNFIVFRFLAPFSGSVLLRVRRRYGAALTAR